MAADRAERAAEFMERLCTGQTRDASKIDTPAKIYFTGVYELLGR